MATPKRPKRPRDVNQLAYRLVQESIGEAERPKVETDPEPSQLGTGITLDEPKKNPHAVALGKLGGRQGWPGTGKETDEGRALRDRQESGESAVAERPKRSLIPLLLPRRSAARMFTKTTRDDSSPSSERSREVRFQGTKKSDAK